MENSIRLRKLAPENVIFVSESGIRTADDIKKLHDNQIEAVLIGETLMRSKDKKSSSGRVEWSTSGRRIKTTEI